MKLAALALLAAAGAAALGGLLVAFSGSDDDPAGRAAAAALDGAYAGRIYGVLVDRTTALYDRDAKEMACRPASSMR